MFWYMDGGFPSHRIEGGVFEISIATGALALIAREPQHEGAQVEPR